MAFKSIGTLAGSVLANVENMRAAAAEIAPQEFETADRASSGEAGNLRSAQDEPAHLLDSVRGLTPRAMGDEGKGAEAIEASAQVAQGVRQTTGKRGGSASVASLPVGKSMVAVTRRKQRQPHASAAIIDLLMWKRDHARSFSRTG